jgi:hypothetical protein
MFLTAGAGLPVRDRSVFGPRGFLADSNLTNEPGTFACRRWISND